LQFSELELSAEVLRGIQAMGFEEPTPIQEKTIIPIMEGRDVIGQAQTGTGKTCAFAIPAVQSRVEDTGRVQVLVLCPTRELAIQTAEEFQSVSKYVEGVRIVPIYGGQSMERQIQSLKRRPQIIIGTPGRVMDHMRRGTIKLDGLRMVILDEADEMLSMGFVDDMETILKKTPDDRQTVLFSATMSKPILDLTRRFQKNPAHIQILHKELTVQGIEQYYIEVREATKLDVLCRVVDGNHFSLCLVFCSTKRGTDALAFSLKARGYSAEALHGDIRQNERSAILARFKSGDVSILVATDVAARGLDVDNIEAVFNYDMPNDEEYYVHRVGRTGRAGRTGQAYTFITGRDYNKLRAIQRFTKATIKAVKPPTQMDIEESRIGMLIKKVAELAAEGDYDSFIPYVEELTDAANAQSGAAPELTVMDIAAALLKMLSEKEAPRRHAALPPTERPRQGRVIKRH
jgi:ATP-dependent RNA helicase DeaD